MSKHTSSDLKLKVTKLKERLPRGWSGILCEKAAAFNRANNLNPKNPEWLPGSKPMIIKVVNNLDYTHRLWPIIMELAEQTDHRRKEREQHLNQLLSA